MVLHSDQNPVRPLMATVDGNGGPQRLLPGTKNGVRECSQTPWSRREGRDSNPRRTYIALNRLAGGPIRPLWHLPRMSLWRRGRDSNPRTFRSTVFKTAALSRSATSPRVASRAVERSGKKPQPTQLSGCLAESHRAHNSARSLRRLYRLALSASTTTSHALDRSHRCHGARVYELMAGPKWTTAGRLVPRDDAASHCSRDESRSEIRQTRNGRIEFNSCRIAARHDIHGHRDR